MLRCARKIALPRAGLARVLSRSHGDHAYVDAGHFHERETAGLGARDWSTRAFTVGIGGPVGSGFAGGEVRFRMPVLGGVGADGGER